MNDDRTATCPQCGEPTPAHGTSHGMCPRCAWSTLEEEDSSDDGMQALPGLQLMSEIARGGMGVVYRAIEAEAGRDVAVKMMQPALADTPEVRERFGQEARAMGALDHPGILPVYRVGEMHGLPFFSMKLAEGGTLAQHLKRYANDWRGIATLMAGIAEAVHHAHQRGLLHRDLKPGNILFDTAGRAYVSDFGLVKMAGVDSSLTRSVSVLGTPHYMAPEVAEMDARTASVASDVWSLGAILYELLAQKLAFQAEGVPALLRKIVDDPLPPLPSAVPRDLATITLKCLQKEPARRYHSAAELAEDLHRWLLGEPVAARRMPPVLRAAYWMKRRPALATMSLILLICLAGSGVLIVIKNQELKHTLRTEFISEARAIRVSANVQQREAGLAAIHKAAQLGSSTELEEEAASLLALPSMRLVQKIEVGRTWKNLVSDAELRNAADFTHPEGVRVVELASRRELAKLPPGVCTPIREPFSNDGRLLMCCDPSEDHLIVYEWSTGRVVRNVDWRNCRGACYSPDSKTLAVGRKDGLMEFYDLEDSTHPKREWPAFNLTPARTPSYSPDGHWIAVADDTYHLSVFDVQSGTLQNTFGIRGEGAVYSCSWLASGRGLMMGTSLGMVRSWSLDGGPSRLLRGHAAQVHGVAVQPEGQIAISSAYDGRSWIMDWPDGRVLGMEPGNSMLTRFSHDGKRLVLQDEALGLLKLYEIASSEVCRQFVAPDLVAGKIMKKGSWCAQVRPGGRILAAVNFGSTDLFDVATSRHLGALPEGHGSVLAWSADGSELWLDDGQALVRWHFEDGADGSVVSHRASRIDLHGHQGVRLALAERADRWALTVTDGIYTGSISKGDGVFIAPPPEMPALSLPNPLALSPDGRWAVISPQYADVLGVLDLKEQHWVKFLPADRLTYAVFSPDSQTCWFSKGSELCGLDMQKREVTKHRADRRDPDGYVFLDMTAKGDLLATMDGMAVMLRHGATGEPFLRLAHPLPLSGAWLSLTPDGRYLTYSGLGHVLQVWDLPRLSAEMTKLGLPWRGPKMDSTEPPKPVTHLEIQR